MQGDEPGTHDLASAEIHLQVNKFPEAEIGMHAIQTASPCVPIWRGRSL
jgi:hypothetical protein